MEIFLVVASVGLVLAGIVGSAIPVLPGPAFSFAGILLLKITDKGGEVDPSHIIFFAVGALFLVALDYLAPALGAKFFGSTKRGIWGAVAGVLVGTVVAFPWGIVLGPLLGAVVGEMSGGKNFVSALRAGAGTFFGTVGALFLQVLYSLVAATYFLLVMF